MTIIKNLIEYSPDFIEKYEKWYYENFSDLTYLWDYINLLDYFKVCSKYKIHTFVSGGHITIEDTKSYNVQYYTGGDAYKDALNFLYNLHENNYDFNSCMDVNEYDIYPYFS